MSYLGGGVSTGGGGSSSSNGGGLKEGFRSKCIGLLGPELGSWTCATWGRVKLFGEGTLSILEDEALCSLWRRLFKVGSSDEGEFRRLGAPGQPHAECSVNNVVDSGEL